MKNRWLYIILAASLGLNLAAFGAFVFHRYRRTRARFLPIRQAIKNAPQRFAPLLNEHHRKMDSLRIEYWSARAELARLALAEDPEPALLEQILQKLGEIHQEMNREVFKTGRNVELLLPPEHRERVRRACCRMIQGPPPGPPPFSRGRGPRRRWQRF